MDRKLRGKSARFVLTRMLVFVILFAILAVGGAQFVPMAAAASEASEAAPLPKAEEAPASEGTPAPEAEEAPASEGTPAPEAEETPAPEGTPAPEAEETPAPEGTPAPEAEEISAPEETPAPEAEETPVPEETPAPESEETPSPETAADPEAEETPGPDGIPVPEAEETPAPEDALPTEAPVESPRVFLKEEIDAMNPNRKIRFYASWGNKTAPEMGDQITLHAQLSGYEGLEYTIRWQFKKSAQDAWQDMGVQGATCTITLTQENLDWLFRVAVDITGVE
jgi:hypothetical protein